MNASEDEEPRDPFADIPEEGSLTLNAGKDPKGLGDQGFRDLGVGGFMGLGFRGLGFRD